MATMRSYRSHTVRTHKRRRIIAYDTTASPREASDQRKQPVVVVKTDRSFEIEESSPMSRMSAFTTPPVIETPRLVLRAHGPGDLENCTAMWAEPAVLRYIRKAPYPREEVWTRILRYGGHWQWLGFGFWIMIEKATGHFVGEIGIQNFERDIEPEFRGTPELGYSITGCQQGKGLATEAARAVLGWFDDHIDISHTNCMTSPDNIHSQRVALKCGYEYVRQSIHQGSPVAMFRRHRIGQPAS